MGSSAPTRELIEGYRAYAGLLDAVGHGVDCAAVAHYVADGTGKQQEVEKVLLGATPGEPGRKRSPQGAAEVPAQAAERMQELARRLLEEIEGLAGRDDDGSADALTKILRSSPEDERDRFSDAVLLNGHRAFLQPRYMSAEDFRGLLDALEDKGRLALVKLVPFLRQELGKRGFALSEADIRRFFDPVCADARVPCCLKCILKGINGEFGVGLISLADMVGDEDPDAWLECVRQKLQFRSHSSMHKAIAEATSLKYDCVHKALSGRKKAKRIQAEIKYCLDAWLQEAAEGREPQVSEDHRGVCVAQMNSLLPALERRFGTKEKIYRLISAKTGIKTGSVRRYFQSNGQLKHAPLAVYRCAAELVTGPAPEEPRRSYLSDSRVRRIASGLAGEANEALRRWLEESDNPELEIAYKELRRALIVTIKEGREPAVAAI